MSEASIRYDVLWDPNGCASVADIAAALLRSAVVLRFVSGIVDVYPKVKRQ